MKNHNPLKNAPESVCFLDINKNKPDAEVIELIIEGLKEDLEALSTAMKRLRLRLEGSGIEHYFAAACRVGVDIDSYLELFLMPETDRFYDLNNVKEYLTNPDIWYAKKMNVDIKTYQRFRNSQSLEVQCNHKGCGNSRSIYFHNIHDFAQAENSILYELWYCPNHQEYAWKKESALADNIVKLLATISERPGCTLKYALDTKGITKSDLKFIEKIGMIAINVNSRSRYSITLTLAGENLMKKIKQNSKLESEVLR